MVPPKLLDSTSVGFEPGQDFVTVVVIISQRGVYFREGQARMLLTDFLRRHGLPLVLHRNTLHADSVSVDAGPAAANSGRPNDMSVESLGVRGRHLLNSEVKTTRQTSYKTLNGPRVIPYRPVAFRSRHSDFESRRPASAS